MKVGLIDVDSHHFLNLALMKLSAYHKQAGDQIEWWNGLKYYDICNVCATTEGYLEQFEISRTLTQRRHKNERRRGIYEDRTILDRWIQSESDPESCDLR